MVSFGRMKERNSIEIKVSRMKKYHLEPTLESHKVIGFAANEWP
jgi:hypothetical protein